MIIKPNSDGVLERFKVWMQDGGHMDKHKKGDKKATWECIRYSCTHDISANPNYADAFAAGGQ